MRNRFDKRLIYFVFTFACTFTFAFPLASRAELIDRVVAYVDDTAITLSDLRESYAKDGQKLPAAEEEEAVTALINRRLLLKEARKMRLEAPSKDEMLKDYIDIKIGSAVIIRDRDIEDFYQEHRKEFGGKELPAVREEIEKYLFEAEVNSQLKKHLKELRADAEIKIQLQINGK